MDARFAHEGKMRKRTRPRQMCSLCNESCPDPDEQIKHYSSTVHKHMKRIKQKQYSYTKNLRTLDEKIKASVEQNEPLIGLEYVYQYAADRKGVVPYVCVLCDRVYKLDTIFFHLVGFKHRCLYLSKHFPALGIGPHFKARTLADCTKLLNASEVIEKCHGRKKINVSSTFFNPKKNGMEYDSDSGREGLSSSEDEQNDRALTKPDWETLRSGASGNNNRSVTQRGDVPFQYDHKSGPPLPNVDRGGPALQYDDRREVQDGRRDMKRPLRDHDVSGIQHDGYSDRTFQENDDRLPMELSYQHRGHDSRKVPGRADFPGGHYPGSQMHRDETAFHADDLKGDNQVRNKDGDFTVQHDSYKRSRLHDLGDPNMPAMGSLPQQVDRDGVRSQNNLQPNRGGAAFQYDVRQSDHGVLDMPSMGLLHQRVDRDDLKSQSHPSGFYGDRDLQSQVHRVGMGFPNDGRRTESQVRNNERDFAFQHDQSTRSLDADMPTLGPLHQQVDRDGVRGLSKTQNHPPTFPGDPKLGLEMDRDRMAYRYDGSDFALRANADDVKSHNTAQNQPSDFFGDRNLQSQIPRGEMGFQYDDRRGPVLQEGLGHTDKQVRETNNASQNERTRLHGDYNTLSMGPLQVDSDGLKSKDGMKSHPSGFLGDLNLRTRMHRDETSLQYDDRRGPMLQDGPRHNDDHLKNDRMQREGMAFQYDDRERPTLPGGPRSTGEQGRNNGRDFSFGDGQRRLGDRDRPPVGTLHQQLDYDVRGFPGDHEKDRLLRNVHGDLDVPSKKSFYREFEERSGVANSRPGFSDDRFAQKHRGGMAYDGRSGVDATRILMRIERGELLSFRELKAAHEAGVSLGPSGTNEQDPNYDSDMEVRSMDLSDSDPDQFLCNTELFEFVRKFKIQSSEDEQFALKARDLLTNGSVRYRKQKEESLKRRIAKEKEQLEEEKKAFLEIQLAKEGPKKKHQQPPSTALNKIQVPLPGPSSTSLFPVGIPGLPNRPIPLMSLVVGRNAGAESNLQQSPPYSGQKAPVAESRPRAVPSVNAPSERRSRWAPESTQTLLEMRLEGRSTQPSERDFVPSRGRDEGTKNLPPRFTTHTSSKRY